MRSRDFSSAFFGHSFAALLLLASAGSAQEWTRFRGPNGTGESEATTIPATWSDADYNWKIDLPGRGHSSPVLWGDKVFLLRADQKTATRYFLCIDANNGKKLWTREFPSTTHNLHVRSSYGSSTPCVDAERVYIAWSDPEHTLLMAFDHAGNDVWTQDFGSFINQHGFGSSPMLYDDMVVLNCSQEPNKDPKNPQVPKQSFIAAVEKTTGKLRWRTERKIDTSSFSVPCVRKTPDGGEELICNTTGEGIFALDPKTGTEKWSFNAFSMRTVSSPVLASGLVFGTTGSGGGGNYIVALKPGSNPELAY